MASDFATPDNAVDLDALHAAICRTIKTALPEFVTVEAYRTDRRNLPTPACLISLYEMEPDLQSDPGTEQLSVRGHFEALILLGRREDKKAILIRKLAARVALLCRFQRWGLRVGAAYPTACEPDAFDPDLDAFDVWRVEWVQNFEIGESIWREAESREIEAYTSFAPDIGSDHKEDYGRID